MDDPRKILESMKDKLKDFKKDLEKIEGEFPEDDSRVLGPSDDIQYEKMKKDLRESKTDE